MAMFDSFIDFFERWMEKCKSAPSAQKGATRVGLTLDTFTAIIMTLRNYVCNVRCVKLDIFHFGFLTSTIDIHMAESAD